MRSFVKIIPALSGVILMMGINFAHAEIALIAHLDNPEKSLTSEQVKQIFLGKTGSFPAGHKAVPVDQKDGSSSRTEFYMKITQKDPSEIKAYWTKLVFSGKGTPPAALDSDADVKAWVAKNPDGLGYINSKLVDGSVKLLLTVP